MLTAIAIISGIGWIINLLVNIFHRDQLGVNAFLATVLVLSTWHSVFPLAIVIIVLTIAINIIGAIIKNQI